MGHFLIRVCFPALFDPEYRKTSESPNVMNDEYMEVFYNDAVRPATSTIIHEDQRRQWPPEYGDELYRTRPGNPPERRQRLARLVRLHTERVVSGDIFGAWFEEIKRLCDTTDKLAFARGLFLLVEGKGLKDNNLSKHHPPVDALVDDGMLFPLSCFSSVAHSPSPYLCPPRRQLDRPREPPNYCDRSRAL
jgi:hypothetical protein